MNNLRNPPAARRSSDDSGCHNGLGTSADSRTRTTGTLTHCNFESPMILIVRLASLLDCARGVHHHPDLAKRASLHSRGSVQYFLPSHFLFLMLQVSSKFRRTSIRNVEIIHNRPVAFMHVKWPTPSPHNLTPSQMLNKTIVCCIVGATFGQERVLVAARLWAGGVRAEYLPTDALVREGAGRGGGLEGVSEACLSAGIPFVVVVRPHALVAKKAVKVELEYV